MRQRRLGWSLCQYHNFSFKHVSSEDLEKKVCNCKGANTDSNLLHNDNSVAATLLSAGYTTITDNVDFNRMIET